jgi:hypothetical protein
MEEFAEVFRQSVDKFFQPRQEVRPGQFVFLSFFVHHIANRFCSVYFLLFKPKERTFHAERQEMATKITCPVIIVCSRVSWQSATD